MSNLFDDQAFKQSAAISLFHGKDLTAWIWPGAAAWTSPTRTSRSSRRGDHPSAT